MTFSAMSARPTRSAAATAGEPGALRVVRPAHELTIMGAVDGTKVGLCRCGWSTTGHDTSDDVSAHFTLHLVGAREPSSQACDVCQRGRAVATDGVVERCARCASLPYDQVLEVVE